MNDIRIVVSIICIQLGAILGCLIVLVFMR
jgi:hypothetical protein